MKRLLDVALVAFLLVGVVAEVAHPRGTAEQWAQYNERYATPPEVKKWIEDLAQPDSLVKCCGEADAYWADSFEVQGDQYVAIITDERKDVPNRPIVAPGTKVLVPKHKHKVDAGNPTGHGVIFLDAQGAVLCYVVPPGI